MIVVKKEVSADYANKMYGESYGFDWIYEQLIVTHMLLDNF